jgi:Flp pilus assembly protein TadD
LLGSAAGCAGGGQRNAEVASRLRIASVAEASGQTEVAMSVMSSLASTASDNADVQARYARALAHSNRVSEADAAVSQALRRKPGDPVLLTELGRIRLLEGRAAEASETFGAVRTARPRELGAVLGRGIAQDLLGQHTEAQASYRAVLAADPQNMPALNNLALSMVLAGDPGSAVPMLQRLASRGDAPARIRNNLSVAQAAVGEQGGLELPFACRGRTEPRWGSCFVGRVHHNGAARGVAADCFPEPECHDERRFRIWHGPGRPRIHGRHRGHGADPRSPPPSEASPKSPSGTRRARRRVKAVVARAIPPLASGGGGAAGFRRSSRPAPDGQPERC